MVDSIDDIARQARQGSVSAIIQILNEKLADSGVRTRAIFDQGVLQLLCEAPTLDQLDQPVLVERVRTILESIQPRHIRRVKINSRIVREQQLLWLEEINRDPERQILWSEDITLNRANPMKRLVEDWQSDRTKPTQSLPKTVRPSRNSGQFWRGMVVGGGSLGLLLLLLGWAVSDWLGLRPQMQHLQAVAPPVATPVSPSSPPPSTDPFVQAVRLAEQAVADGKAASTSADWLDLASRWQRASDLMAQVPANDSRYKTAQDRIQLYAQNSKASLEQATKVGESGGTASSQVE